MNPPGDDLRYGRLRTMQPTLENRKIGQRHHEEKMKCSIERKPKNEPEERELSGIMKRLKKRLFKGCPGEGDQFSPFHQLTILDKYFTQVGIIGVEMLPMFEDHLITITDVFSDEEDFSIGDRDDGCTVADIVINSWVETISGHVPPAFFDGKGTVRCA